jgi:hypothetical protein
MGASRRDHSPAFPRADRTLCPGAGTGIFEAASRSSARAGPRSSTTLCGSWTCGKGAAASGQDARFRLGSPASLRRGRPRPDHRPARDDPRPGLEHHRFRTRACDCGARADRFADHRPFKARRPARPARQDPGRGPRLAGGVAARLANCRRPRRPRPPWRRRKSLHNFAPGPFEIHGFLTLSI